MFSPSPALRPAATAAVLLLCLGSLPGCQAINDVLPTDPDSEVNAVTLFPSGLTLFVGEQSQLTATGYSVSGLVVSGKKTTWSSELPSVATVSATGLVTAVGEGITGVTATIQGKSQTMYVQVNVPAQRLTISATPGMPAWIKATTQTTPATTYDCIAQAGQTASCNFNIPYRTGVTIRAFVSGQGTHTFTGWSGEGCSSTTRCEVVMTGPRNVTASYAPRINATLNLAIDGATITQAVQRFDQSVPLVAGRDAYVRVYAIANQTNTAQPRVRIRIFNGNTEVQSTLVNAGSPSMEIAVPVLNEATPLATTWNVAVPGSLVVPGLRFSAEVDPEGQIAELSETDNRFPLNGTPRDATVRNLPPLQVRMIPIRQTATGLLGDVSAANLESYFSLVKKVLPVGAYQADIRATYTTSVPTLTADDGNLAWSMLLNEVLALRNTTDQSTRYYYGVVKVNYFVGISGVGRVPDSPAGLSKAAVGVDIPAEKSQTFAHELGHNFGRAHAPCGATKLLDEFYPDRNGLTGATGLDLATLEPKAATSYDLMSYCYPQWVSDYTWNFALQWRLESPTGAPPALSAGGPDDGLLVWGRIAGTRVTLEPAFRTAPIGVRPDPRGTWRVEGRDASNALLFSEPFEPEAVADLPGEERQFAFVLPSDAATLDRLASLRVSGPGGAAEQRTRSGPPEPGDQPAARSVGPGVRRITWDGGRHPMAMIRDARTGEILSFARGGAVDLWSDRGSFDVQLSDGVRGVRRIATVR